MLGGESSPSVERSAHHPYQSSTRCLLDGPSVVAGDHARTHDGETERRTRHEEPQLPRYWGNEIGYGPPEMGQPKPAGITTSPGPIELVPTFGAAAKPGTDSAYEVLRSRPHRVPRYLMPAPAGAHFARVSVG